MKTIIATSRRIAAALLLCIAGLPVHAVEKAKPSQAAVTGDTILVTVNGQPVRRALFDGMVKARTEHDNPYDEPEQGTAAKPKSAPVIDKEAVFEDLLNMEILSQKARERGIHLRPGVVAEAELQYKTLLQQELVREIIDEIRVDPAEVKARYDAQKPERSYNVSHILLNSERKAQAVISELDKGAKFAAVARKRTLDANTRKDGSLGWMMASQLEQSFVAGIETLKPSGYSRTPVKTRYGWHVIQLHGARFLDKPPFEKAQEWLRQEILHEKVNGRIAQMKREARIEVPKLQ